MVRVEMLALRCRYSITLVQLMSLDFDGNEIMKYCLVYVSKLVAIHDTAVTIKSMENIYFNSIHTSLKSIRLPSKLFTFKSEYLTR